MDGRLHSDAVTELAERVLLLDAAQRSDFLLKACADKPELLEQVCSQLSLVPGGAADEATAAMETFAAGEIVGGRFRILRFVAHGGMGSVYLAEDLELGDRVALKAVRSDKSSRWYLAGLRREVQLARQVTHPNVCRIYDLGIHGTDETSKNRIFLTMEYLEGKTLSERIREGSLAEAEIFDIARQAAMALAAAHKKGIVHGDFKSSNIMLVDEGSSCRAVVTDFGLAHVPEGGSKPDRHREGKARFGGTPAYMSPEQLVGGQVGPQADLFAFGVVLFEMATRALPFAGSLSDRLRGGIAVRPSIQARGLNPKLEAIILRCFERDLEKRYANAEEILRQLGPSPSEEAKSKRRRAVGMWLAVATLIAAICLVVAWPGLFSSTPHEAFTFIPITNQPGEQLFPTLSPDGARVAYSWEKNGISNIYVQAVGGGKPLNITADCKAGDSEPAWSPDGQQVAYRCERDGGGISISAAEGKWNRRLTTFGHQASWSPDGSEVVIASERMADLSGIPSDLSPLWIVNVKDGAMRSLPTGEGFQPSWSPHGKRIAFWSFTGGRRMIRTIPVAGGQASVLLADKSLNWNPVWSADGRWMYFLSDRGGSMNLWRIGVDEESGRANSEPVAVTLPATYVQHLSVSRDGRSIAYVQKMSVANLFRVPFDSESERAGAAEQLTFGVRLDSMPSISPRGAELAFVTSTGEPDEIYIMAAKGTSTPRQITDNSDKSVRLSEPRWSPNGTRIAFQSNYPGDKASVDQIWTMRPDGSELKQMTHIRQDAFSPVWGRTGTKIAFSVFRGPPWFLKIGSAQPEPFAPVPDQSMSFIAKSWSADGSRIVGSKLRRDGAPAGLFVYSIRERRYDTVTSFGSAPVWLNDGRRILFRSGGGLYVADTRSHAAHPIALQPNLRIFDTFVLSGDNRWMVVSSTAEQTNVWIARNTQ